MLISLPEHHPSFSFCLNASSSSELAVFIVCWTKTALMIFKTAKPQIAMSKHQFFGKVSPSNFPITLQQQSHLAAKKRPTRCFYMFSTFSFRRACRICARWFKQTLGELVFKSHRFMYKLNSDIDATSVTNWEYITHHVRTTPLSLTWRTLEHTTVDERWSAQVKHPRSNLST